MCQPFKCKFFIPSLVEGDSKLIQLLEKQNNKQNNKISNQQTNGHAPVFERSDLRNSLREKRAARDREAQRQMLESRSIMNEM